MTVSWDVGPCPSCGEMCVNGKAFGYEDEVVCKGCGAWWYPEEVIPR